jgi:tagatose-1,6-bisphosphate aldolase non-catalytic subunit AgaZ/GatZ
LNPPTTPAEEAAHHARRKELLIILGAVSTPGGDRANCQVGTLQSYAQQAAERSGKSDRAIHRAVQRAETLGEDIQAVVGTTLDKGVELDALAKLNAGRRGG